MENVSTDIASFLLLGLVEMERFKYLYGSLSLVIYLIILSFSATIVLVVLTNQSLYEPMYLLICNLLLNGIFGTTSFFPKLSVDLFSSSFMVSRASCFIQALCVGIFAVFEIFTFNIMAYDRYLAVCHPLHYATMMSNEKVLKLIVGFWIILSTLISIAILLTEKLPQCDATIDNIFCDNMALVKLSCVDSSVNNIYGAVWILSLLIFSLLTIVYTYLRIFLICLKISKDAYQKAIHTLVTHLLSFSVLLVGILFVFIRYRLKSVDIPLFVHVLLSVTFLVFPPLFNPLIYGIRTKALRVKIIMYLPKINIWKKV